MALLFPSTGLYAGYQYTDDNQVVWVYDGEKWDIYIGVTSQSGYSGISGYSGVGTSGYSGASGTSGFSGVSGKSGYSGISGYSGSPITVTDDVATSSAVYPVWNAATSGTLTPKVSSTKLSFIPSTGLLTLSVVDFGANVQQGFGTFTTSNTSQIILDAISSTTYRSAKYFVQMTSGTAYQVSELSTIHDGANAYLVEYGENKANTASALGTFDTNVSSGNLNLLFTPVNASTTVKLFRTAIDV